MELNIDVMLFNAVFYLFFGFIDSRGVQILISHAIPFNMFKAPVIKTERNVNCETLNYLPLFSTCTQDINQDKKTSNIHLIICYHLIFVLSV